MKTSPFFVFLALVVVPHCVAFMVRRTPMSGRGSLELECLERNEEEQNEVRISIFSPPQPRPALMPFRSSFYESESCPDAPIEIISIKREPLDEDFRSLFESVKINVPRAHGDSPNQLEESAQLLDDIDFSYFAGMGSDHSDSAQRKRLFGDNGDGTLKTITRLQRELDMSSQQSTPENSKETTEITSTSNSLRGFFRFIADASPAVAFLSSADEKKVQLQNIALALYIVGHRFINGPYQHPVSKRLSALYMEALLIPENRERLINITTTTPTTCNKATQRMDPFRAGSGLERWGRENCANENKPVLVFSHDALPPIIIQRGSTCFIAAAAMWVAHLLHRIEPSEPWKLFDFHDISLQTFTELDLLKRVCDNDGGVSLDVFKKLLHDESQHKIVEYGLDLPSSQDCVDNYYMSPRGENCPKECILYNQQMYSLGSGIKRKLGKYGPALMEGAYLSQDMLDMRRTGRRSFRGIQKQPEEYLRPESGEPHAYHAMLIVGAQKDSEDIWWFNLQNWWEDAEYIEVDLARLRSMMKTRDVERRTFRAGTRGVEVLKYNALKFVEGNIKLRDYEARPGQPNRLDYAEDGGYDERPPCILRPL